MKIWRDANLKIASWVESWKRRGYPAGIPDEAPEVLEKLGRAPSYRMICETILANDHTLERLGYSRQKCRVYMDLKRVELRSKGREVLEDIGQLQLFPRG